MFNLKSTPLLLTLLALHQATASPTPNTDTSVLAPRYELGGINVSLACLTQNGIGWVAVRLGDKSGDWKCRKGQEWQDVNMDAACAAQYNYPEAWASAGSKPGLPGSVYDWTCQLDS